MSKAESKDFSVVLQEIQDEIDQKAPDRCKGCPQHLAMVAFRLAMVEVDQHVSSPDVSTEIDREIAIIDESCRYGLENVPGDPPVQRCRYGVLCEFPHNTSIDLFQKS